MWANSIGISYVGQHMIAEGISMKDLIDLKEIIQFNRT